MPKKPTQTLGQRIRELRTAAQLTQVELCARAGIYQQSLSDIELDRTDPAVSTLRKVAKGLAVPVAQLLE